MPETAPAEDGQRTTCDEVKPGLVSGPETVSGDQSPGDCPPGCGHLTPQGASHVKSSQATQRTAGAPTTTGGKPKGRGRWTAKTGSCRPHSPALTIPEGAAAAKLETVPCTLGIGGATSCRGPTDCSGYAGIWGVALCRSPTKGLAAGALLRVSWFGLPKTAIGRTCMRSRQIGSRTSPGGIATHRRLYREHRHHHWPNQSPTKQV